MHPMPEGTVTFLFSDVEGSTQLLERHGPLMGEALWRHHAILEEAVDRHGGVVFETVGDAMYAAFQDPGAAVATALEAQRAFATENWGEIGRLAIRIAIHMGDVERRGDHYFGAALFRAARLQAIGYGEQTLLSAATARTVADALPAGASLRNLGTHRLKDLGQPERVYQLVHPDLRARFPAVKSIDARPHNLPVQLTSFVGRERELDDLKSRLGEARSVTLIGEGGIGKTRLALQTAAEAIDRFEDGIFFVDLASLRDPELVPGAIASVLGLREQPGQAISASLLEHLQGRSMLLVLDNLEQLLPAVADTVAALLGGAPNVSVLATSRSPLHIAGEREYRVPPLAAGSGDRLDHEVPAAVALFVDRARLIAPDLTVDAETGPIIAEICERLDGLPLAIELAAQHLRVFGIGELRERLRRRLPLLSGGRRDAPSRQRTLRSAIAWSEELLSESERQLFAGLAAFVGPVRLEAIEAIAVPESSIEVVDWLAALVDSSLVRRVEAAGESRFTMLETVREYAAERLEAMDAADGVTRRSIDYWADAAERFVAEIVSPRLARGRRRGGTEGATARMERDYLNARNALIAAIDRRDQRSAFRIISGLSILWIDRGPWREALDLGSRTLDLGDPAVTDEASSAIHRLGIVAQRAGDLRRARHLWLQALAMRRALGDLNRIESTLTNLASVAETPLEAMGYIEEALEIKRALGTEMQDSYCDLASVHLQLDELDAGERNLEEALALARDVGDPVVASATDHWIGRLAQQRGETGHARTRFHAAIDAAQASGEPWAVAATMAAVAVCDLHDGLVDQGVDRIASAIRLVPGDDWELYPEHRHEILVAATGFARRRGMPLVAAEICGALARARASDGNLQPPCSQREINALARAILAELDEGTFWEAWRRGRAAGWEREMELASMAVGPSVGTREAANAPAATASASVPAEFPSGDRVSP